MSNLRIAESFFSVQGEGASVGVPSYFIRLQGCNLLCGGPNASLVKEGKATWWCDSEVIWKRGTPTTYDDLIQKWKDEGLLDRIINGSIHLIWTGGEPTIPRHEKAIIGFLEYLKVLYPDDRYVYNEIETNGTIVTKDLYNYMQQINCSPKLVNSGMSASMRINPLGIKQVNDHPNGWFKFVISTEEDIKEIQETYLKPFNIKDTKVIIMPGVDNRADLPERTAFLFDMTKKYGYRGVTRQHILAYNMTTGV